MSRDCGKCYEIERLSEENCLLRNEISDLENDNKEFKKRNSDLVNVVFEKDNIIREYIAIEKEYKAEDARLERENIKLRKELNEFKDMYDKSIKTNAGFLDRINQLKYESNVLFNEKAKVEADMKKVKEENEKLSEMITENLLTIASLTRQLEAEKQGVIFIDNKFNEDCLLKFKEDNKNE